MKDQWIYTKSNAHNYKVCMSKVNTKWEEENGLIPNQEYGEIVYPCSLCSI